MIVAIVLLVGITLFFTGVILPQIYYKKGLQHQKEGEYAKAAVEFQTAMDMSSTYDNEECQKRLLACKCFSANVGDIIQFGHYNIWSSSEDYGDEIDWIVLAKEDSKMLIISNECLDYRPFVNENGGYISSWLNGSFYNASFSEDEGELITENSGDKVFLLSAKDVEEYFDTAESRKTRGTGYAKTNGMADGYVSWWLEDGNIVNAHGEIKFIGFDNYFGVRPAVWLNIE